jgi:hypothetical protein
MNIIHWMKKAKQKGDFLFTKQTHVLFISLNSYAFFEFDNEQMAVEAVKQTDGYRLDKNHTFSVNLMSEFDRYEKTFDKG